MILKRLYEDKVIRTTLRKRTMKKLIIDLTVKQHSFNNKIFKQIDGVLIGSGLCLVLRNIIMTELENIIVKDLVDKFVIKNTCDLLMTSYFHDIKLIHERLNSDDKNIKFTTDNFLDGNVHISSHQRCSVKKVFVDIS